MAYGYNRNNQSYGQQQQGGYQQQGQGNYNRASQTPPPTPEDFINERLDVYLTFMEAIKARGLDPSDFVFALGGWVTSFTMTRKGK